MTNSDIDSDSDFDRNFDSDFDVDFDGDFDGPMLMANLLMGLAVKSNGLFWPLLDSFLPIWVVLEAALREFCGCSGHF